jgi:hypothetical protein
MHTWTGAFCHLSRPMYVCAQLHTQAAGRTYVLMRCMAGADGSSDRGDASKAPFGLEELKFNSHHINVLLNA